MRKPITVYKGGRGLYTREDPVRLEFDGENGVNGLAYAVNVVCSDTGRISRRGGYTKVSTDVYHSIFPYDSTRFLGINGSSLRLVSVLDFSYTNIATVTEGAKGSYVRVGAMVLFVNGYETGIIENGVWSDWVVGTPSGRYASKKYYGPPAGTLVTYYANSVFIAEDNVLWYSEAPSINLFRKASGYLYYGSNINMVCPVATGLYLSTENRVRYLGGKTAETLAENILTDYPAIRGTDVLISGLVLGGNLRNPEPVCVFTTTEGICVGGSDKVFGSILFDNLTRERFDYPSGSEGTATVIDNVYVVNIYK